jgi:hypothetical protein
MRYRVTRFGYGFEVICGDRAEMISDHTIIAYQPTGLVGAMSCMTGKDVAFLTVSESTPKEDLLTALRNEVQS